MSFRCPSRFLQGQTRVSSRLMLQTNFRSFHASRVRLLKEDGDRSPQELENKKQEQIDKQKRGEGHWHEELASSGESNVKADKEDVDDHGEHMEDLQKHTANKSEKGDL